MECSTMTIPINSGLSDAEPCEAGHYLPCTVCGAESYDRCNGGQYVSPGLRAVPRTERQVAQTIRRRNRITEVEKDARNANH